MADSERKGLRGLPRIVWLLGLASLFNDVSSEALFPLLPLFLTDVLGATPMALGVIEGAADALSAVVKVVAGRWSDRGPRRVLVAGGYGLPAVARAVIAAAAAPWQVLAGRLTDRVGKGIRSGPRDALLAEAVEPDDRGRAFGLHRSMDHTGAAIGPLIASVLLKVGLTLRQVFWAGAGIGLAAPVLLLARLKDAPRDAKPGRAGDGRADPPGDPAPAAGADAPLGSHFWHYMAAAALFGMANSSDAFLLAKAHEVGWSAAALPMLWFAHHLAKAATGVPGGALSDRLPRAAVVAAGWIAYALSYAGFAAASSKWLVAGLFLFYAVYHGLAEAAERALVADLSPAGARGRAYGWYYGLAGVAALPAGVLTGWLWKTRGSEVALMAEAAFALAAAAVAAALWLRRRA